MLVIQPPVIFSIFTQHLIRIFALEVLATRFDLIGLEPCLQRNRLLTELVSSQGVIRLRNTSNRSMKPAAPLRYNFSVFATTPCRGLSLSR
jgi:hypothetical protein